LLCELFGQTFCAIVGISCSVHFSSLNASLAQGKCSVNIVGIEVAVNEAEGMETTKRRRDAESRPSKPPVTPAGGRVSVQEVLHPGLPTKALVARFDIR